MSALTSILSTCQRLGVFSLVLLLGFMSCETKTISPENSNNPVYPLIPAELVGQEIDTIITFNPDTYEESVRYEIHDPAKNIQADTIITFDPETFDESMMVIKYTNGQVDTIKVY